MKLATLICLCTVILFAPGAVEGGVYIYPQAELMNFQHQTWSQGSLDAGYPQNPSGPSVRFVINLGENPSEQTAIGDNWPIEPAAGLEWDGGYYPGDPSNPHASAHDNVSIAAWDGIQMPVKYLSGPGDIQLRLFMNTGLTGSSGYPANDADNDTRWQGPMTTFSVGDLSTLTLDFSNAEVWGANDNKAPHSGAGENWGDGTWRAINERDLREVTNLGFEVFGPAAARIELDANAVPEPGTISMWAVMFLLAALGICLSRLRRRGNEVA